MQPEQLLELQLPVRRLALLLLPLAGCATTAAGFQREAAWMFENCRNVVTDSQAAACRQDADDYCREHQLPKGCYEVDVALGM